MNRYSLLLKEYAYLIGRDKGHAKDLIEAAAEIEQLERDLHAARELNRALFESVGMICGREKLGTVTDVRKAILQHTLAIRESNDTLHKRLLKCEAVLLAATKIHVFGSVENFDAKELAKEALKP